MIENYLGFPNGISGSELATRAVVQARRFGADCCWPGRWSTCQPMGRATSPSCLTARWCAGGWCCSPAESNGAAWRCPGSMTCSARGSTTGPGRARRWRPRAAQVVVVGGGNSAGQAVVRFSRYAQRVTLLVRGRDLGASMSPYLIDQVTAIPNVDVRVHTEVAGLEADDRLRAVIVRSGDSANRCSCGRMPCSSASAAPPTRAAPRGSGWPPTPPGTWSPAAMAPVIRAVAGPCPGSRCRWRPVCPECSPQATCAAGRSTLRSRHWRGINGRGAVHRRLAEVGGD